MFALLISAILFTILHGDQAGIEIAATFPHNIAHTTSEIRVSFKEPMDTASVEAHFVIEPPVMGKITWNESQFIFKPAVPLVSGQHYTVRVRAGALSKEGRQLSREVFWSFDVGTPKIVYLSPAIAAGSTKVPNLWIADPLHPAEAKQLTFSSYGVDPDFTVSPDGTRIAFSQKGDEGSTDLYVVAVDTGAIQRVTQCKGANCHLPSWNPTSTKLVYEGLDKSTGSDNANRPQAWIVDLDTLITSPLFADPTIHAHAPRWSPNGNQIAVYDPTINSIVVYSLIDGKRLVISTLDSDAVVFDFSGTRLVYREMLKTMPSFIPKITVANLNDPQNGLKPLLAKDDKGEISFEDRQAAWHPDGKHLVVARRYLDERFTQGAQVYVVDADTAVAESLVLDGNYNHAALSWEPLGNLLVMQRFPYNNQTSEPSVWVYDRRTKQLQQVAKNAFLPQWIP